MGTEKSENWETTPSNEEVLEELVWTLESSRGEFKLILARCNYLRLRSQLVKRLQVLTDIDIQVLQLQRSDKTLYTTIHAQLQARLKNQLGCKQPEALMVFNLESVSDITQMFSTTNQVREEFRKHFHFPVVLWVTDEVLHQFLHSASDFESWATSIEFSFSTPELIRSLQKDSDALFTSAMAADMYDIGWEMGYLRRREITSALKDLERRKQKLEPVLKANVEFVQGQNAYLKNQITIALKHYHQSLDFWSRYVACPRDIIYSGDLACYVSTIKRKKFIAKLKIGLIMFNIGLCYWERAQTHRVQSQNDLEQAKSYFQQSINTFTETDRPHLVAKFINSLGEVLRQLKAWRELLSLAENSLGLQQLYGNPIQVAQTYSFFAEVAYYQKRWLDTKHYIYKALHNLSKVKSPPQSHRSLYLMLLAQAENKLGQVPRALKHLQMAADIGIQSNPHQYIRILRSLRSLYREQKQYLQAFRTKLQERFVEQQYAWRAFVGPGILQSVQQSKLKNFVETPYVSLRERFANASLHGVAPEIFASGRKRDIEHLLERIARPDYKLIVIHGYPGVGKSSLVQAGLLPAVRQRYLGTQDIIPIQITDYHYWTKQLVELLLNTLKQKNIIVENQDHSFDNILRLLKKCEEKNIRILLIFDHLEELLSIENLPIKRKLFFRFISKCLNILTVKIIILLRQEYLYILSDINSHYTPSIINDIYHSDVLYQVGNISINEVKPLIEDLTKLSNFHLEEALIEHLVEELATGTAEVSPLELQVLGTQLQTENITTLEQYLTWGPKSRFIQRYIQEVITDCGDENKQAAELVIELLTNNISKFTIQTNTELAGKLSLLAVNLKVKKRNIQKSQLNLVLQIFIESGVVSLLSS
ncbi:MAG: ATP-binding protein [Mastigocoleus sp. MO_167.B18]|nr:ATP-binding protein [Mastigocoleus sp. MO_167.B18]